MTEGQKMKRLKDKQTKGQTVIYKTLHRKLRFITGSKLIRHYLFVS
jgi:hypothetical protein